MKIGTSLCHMQIICGKLNQQTKLWTWCDRKKVFFQSFPPDLTPMRRFNKNRIPGIHQSANKRSWVSWRQSRAGRRGKADESWQSCVENNSNYFSPDNNNQLWKLCGKINTESIVEECNLVESDHKSCGMLQMRLNWEFKRTILYSSKLPVGYISANIK